MANIPVNLLPTDRDPGALPQLAPIISLHQPTLT